MLASLWSISPMTPPTPNAISSSSSPMIPSIPLSLHAWFAKFSSLLTTFGFASYIVDPTVLTKKTEGNLIILAIYINGIFVTESAEASISTIKTYLYSSSLSRSMPSTCFKR
ncbi:unnamed protein product [Spirodela intermedia]|uniref:Uncharacterized protein n=1 Tax=Spirodela intermedia TaxID=51605 RepID=A0ABN7ED24_SPIIN|nr:unnamed protein product [Spirodela intermedia]